jgi:hypothetical protein
MKRAILKARRLATISMVAILLLPAAQAVAQQVNEAAEIVALKKKVAEQSRQITQLEQQVQALLAAKNAPPATAASTTDRENEAAQTSRVSSETPEVPASRTPTAGQSMSRPEIEIAGINVSGDAYLYQYVPVGVPGVQPKFELYAFSVQLDGQHGPWGFHSDYRLRTTKLRSFYPGNTWLQQGYVHYRTPLGEFRAGSFYRRVGLDWDDSFFGNIQYFDGLKLDPEFGVDFEGAHSLAGRLGAEYSVQYFSTDARINGSLPGRDFVSEAAARAKNDVTVRFAPVWHLNDWASLTVGGSVGRGAIDRDNGPNNSRRQVAADATLKLGPVLTYGELLRQTVSTPVVLPPQDATYTLAGVRWARGRYQPRLNYSQANYHDLNRRREFIFQPGITVRLADGFSFIYEHDFWQDVTQASRTTLDRSLNLVLNYHF